MGKRYGRNQKRRDQKKIQELEAENKRLKKYSPVLEKPYDPMNAISLSVENPSYSTGRKLSVRLEVDMKRICLERHISFDELYYLRTKPIGEYVEAIAKPIDIGVRQELYQAIGKLVNEIRGPFVDIGKRKIV